jgi:hypothetical protein
MKRIKSGLGAAILTAIGEGNSIASTWHMFGVNKIVVLRLLADTDSLAADYRDLVVRELGSERIQLDEIWSFVQSINHDGVLVFQFNSFRGKRSCELQY